MCSFVKRTAIRGRSLVPETFLRIRQWRSCRNFCFLSLLMFYEPRILPCASKLLLDCLTFLTDDMLVAITNTFTFVRFRRVVAAEFRSNFADELFARAFDGDFGVFFHLHRDLVRYGIIDRVRIAEGHVHNLALDSG